MPSETAADLLAVLCADGISTREEATEISGRGVGLSAVKERVEALRGRMDVRSTSGVGTTWSFHFPTASAKERLHSESQNVRMET
jgi:two-component system chemotaxis sensor kinase CheA